jgi:prepilin-type N-terminal cleavage/methylation domain-containing protein
MNYRGRPGFSLVEIMVVVVVTSAIAATAASLLVTALRANNEVLKSQNQQRVLARFELTVRADIRQAERAELVDEPASSVPMLRLSNAEGAVVEYQSNVAGLDRRQYDAERKLIAREQFAVHIPVTAVWELDKPPSQGVTLRFVAQGHQRTVPAFWLAYRIRCVAGRNTGRVSPAPAGDSQT